MNLSPRATGPATSRATGRRDGRGDNLKMLNLSLGIMEIKRTYLILNGLGIRTNLDVTHFVDSFRSYHGTAPDILGAIGIFIFKW